MADPPECLSKRELLRRELAFARRRAAALPAWKKSVLAHAAATELLLGYIGPGARRRARDG
jgi:hypothetical protein